jgi:hypothetical protein
LAVERRSRSPPNDLDGWARGGRKALATPRGLYLRRAAVSALHGTHAGRRDRLHPARLAARPAGGP